MIKAVLHRMLKHLDSAPVDSHSLSQLIYTELYSQRIEAALLVGTVNPSTVDGQKIANHAWIESCGYIIDYRLAKLIGHSAPHGIFTVADALGSGCVYDGDTHKTRPLDKHVIEFLTATSPALIP